MFPASTKGGGQNLAFPDVCITPPSPPAGAVPLPYPNSQFQDNLKEANAADAKAQAGNKAAQNAKKKAIRQLKEMTGLDAGSATSAVLMGYGAMKKAEGDEAGLSKGISGSKGAVKLGTFGTSNANNGAGSQFNLAPSQTKVLIGS